MGRATSDLKPCIRCREVLPLDSFHPHKQMADGHLNACKPCVRKSSSAWGKSNRKRRLTITTRHQANSPQQYCRWRGWLPQQVPPWYSELDSLVWEEARDLACRMTALTGVTHEVDHRIPGKSKTACGLHWHANWRVVTQQANLRKWANHA